MDSPDPVTDFAALRVHLAERGPAAVEEVDSGRAAVAVVLAPLAPGAHGAHDPGDPGGLELLLIRRAERARDPWSGHIGLPGGRRADADADLLETARRETREETGIELAGADLLGRLDDLHPMTGRLPSIVVRPFVFGMPARPSVVHNHEVAYHRWVPLTDLSARRRNSIVLHRGAPREVASYWLGRDVVWGMTHRILDPLLQFYE